MRINAFVYIVSALITPLLPGPNSHSQEQSQNSYLHFEPTAIIDYAGLGQPTAAMTLFIPKGWQTDGGIVWGNQHLCTNGYAVQWQALSPDKTSGALILPQWGWEFNSVNGKSANVNCPILQIYNVEAYLHTVIQNLRPDAQNITFRQRPDLLAEFPQTFSEQPWTMGVQQSWVETGELAFTFSEQGKTMEGHLAAGVTFLKTITNTASYYSELVQASALPAYGTFAPLGQYNPMLFRAIRKSLQPDAYWNQEISKHNTKMNSITLNGIAARGKIAADANRDINNIISNSWRRQQISSDRRAREFLEVIRETETYSDPNTVGGEVELSNHYNHAWKLEDGTYVLTDQAGFNPIQVLGMGGERLRPAQ